jgi:hypothetical protein
VSLFGGTVNFTTGERPVSAKLPDLPRTADGHFRLLFHTAVLRLLAYLKRLPEAGQSLRVAFPFLESYAAELRACLPEESEATLLPAWTALLDAWERSCPTRLPLRELARSLELGREEQVLLLLAGLVEEDIRFAGLFAALQEPLAARRPCLGLAGAIASGFPLGQGDGRIWAAARRLSDAGVLALDHPESPRAEWLLRLPPPLWDALRGQIPERPTEGCHWQSRRDFPPLKQLVLPEDLRHRLQALPALLARGGPDTVILRGPRSGGRRTVLGALARALRRDLLYCELRTEPYPPWLGAFCTLTGALPALALDPGPGETLALPPLTGYRGPLGVKLPLEGGIKGPERPLTLTLPLPTPAERLAVWRVALGTSPGPTAELAERFLLPLGSVWRAAAMARIQAGMEQRRTVTAADVLAATRSLDRQALDTLAQRLEPDGGWERLVVGATEAADLRELEARCRHRERLADELGPGFGVGPGAGVRALFNGPSGTGKSLAARILAGVLAKDLYRVDLAAVVNKYIGETEKNLSRLFARAEELDVVLLIDEGDALLGSRTEVKTSTDRYANLETNYLLQRLETYQGIVLVTTNAGRRIDSAFQRRFDVVVDFLPPNPEQRLAIWDLHLPAGRRLATNGLATLARNCALTGGQIRNAALHAALLTLEAGRPGRIHPEDLEQAVRREYRKAGAVYPQGEIHPVAGQQDLVRRLLADLG